MKPSNTEFESLALEQMDTLYRFARRLTRDAGQAEDLVQETYARAFGARGSFQLEDGMGIRPWLLRIMQNLHFSRSAREKKAPSAMDTEGLASSVIAPAAISNDGLTLNLEDLDGPLHKALEELPIEYQTVLLLWAVEDMSYKEIATVVDVPIGTVMSRLHRARQRLTEELHEYAVREGVIRAPNAP